MKDTSIKGFEKVGIKITQEQLNRLGFLNAINDSDFLRDKVFYIAVVLRILNALPDEMMCEPTDRLGVHTNTSN